MRNDLKKYSWILVFLAGFSGGSYMTLITFAASWVEMNSRPAEVVDAADLAPGTLKLVHENQDEISELWDVFCDLHPEEC